MARRRLIAFAVAATLTAAALALPACRPAGQGSPPEAVLDGTAMGTGWRVRFVIEETVPPRGALAGEVAAVIEAVEAEFSHWRPASAVSRFNAHASTDPFPVSEAFHDLVATALEVSRRSGGAYDVTVGPLVAANGFGPPTTDNRPPVIESRPPVAGHRHLTLHRDPPALAKSDPAVQLDFSSIAKGLAVDQVAARLDDLGIRRYLVELGGEVKARGHAPAGRPWRVGLEAPDPGRRALAQTVEISAGALATSGTYRQVKPDGTTHFVDPRTGLALTADHPVRSSSVLHPSAALADAWATALLVLGHDAAATARREGLDALLIGPTGAVRTGNFPAPGE